MNWTAKFAAQHGGSDENETRGLLIPTALTFLAELLDDEPTIEIAFDRIGTLA